MDDNDDLAELGLEAEEVGDEVFGIRLIAVAVLIFAGGLAALVAVLLVCTKAVGAW